MKKSARPKGLNKAGHRRGSDQLKAKLTKQQRDDRLDRIAQRIEEREVAAALAKLEARKAKREGKG